MPGTCSCHICFLLLVSCLVHYFLVLSHTYLVPVHLTLFLNFVVFLTIFLFFHLILWFLLFLALLLKSVICSKLSSFCNCLRFSHPVKLYVILSLSSDFGDSHSGFPLSGKPLFLLVLFLVAFQEALLHCLITIACFTRYFQIIFLNTHCSHIR